MMHQLYIYSTIFIAYLFYIFLRKKILWNFSQFQYWCNCTLTTTLRKTMRQVDHLIPKSSLQAHSVCLMGKLWCSLSLSKNITQTNTILFAYFFFILNKFFLEIKTTQLVVDVVWIFLCFNYTGQDSSIWIFSSHWQHVDILIYYGYTNNYTTSVFEPFTIL